jgi:hypothetical protein
MHPWAERRTITSGRNCGEARSTAETGANAIRADFQNSIAVFGYYFLARFGYYCQHESPPKMADSLIFF